MDEYVNMDILITNDDGIEAEGINILFDVLSENHNVYMIAPDKEKSACSNAITIRKNLTFKKIDKQRYTVSGYPADCASIGIHSGKIPIPDIVISGINHGPNLGDDIFFSGTVGGARTAYIFGRSGIAVSLNSREISSPFFKDAAIFTGEFIEENENDLKSQPQLFNINYPELSPDRIKGVSFTTVGKRIYIDNYISEPVSDIEEILLLDGVIESLPIDQSDASALDSGYISITPLTIDCTDYIFPALNLKIDKSNAIKK